MSRCLGAAIRTQGPADVGSGGHVPRIRAWRGEDRTPSGPVWRTSLVAFIPKLSIDNMRDASPITTGCLIFLNIIDILEYLGEVIHLFLYFKIPHRQFDGYFIKETSLYIHKITFVYKSHV